MTDPARATLAAALAPVYTLTSELGGGGMSRVFVAREETLGRDVVVKVLAPEVSAGLSVERFTREIRLAAALQHPHIVPVLAAGVTNLGMPWYTMPFVRGASLRDRLSRGPIPVDEAIRLLRDVAQALGHAHAQNVVHRDIKPENILLSSGSAVVTDFGIAKALRASRTEDATAADTHGITRTGMSLGTPAYMAPEQAAGDPDTDQRADLYAWGVVAYELLSGLHPFAGRTSPQQLLTAHMVDVPEPLPDSRDVPSAVASLVMQCLAKDPADRPPTAAHLLAVLNDVRGSKAGDQAGDRNVHKSGTANAASAARNRGLLVAGLAVAVVASAGTWWRGSARTAASSSAPTPLVMMAVLPFEHAGPADQQPFTDGLTDAVTAKLGGLSSLMVIDRRSAATYRGTTKSTQQIGTELGVRYLLEGVVRWAKDGAGVWRARVTPTLVDAKSGAIKWTGEPATVTLDDPFTAQGSIATDVAAAMEVAVLPKERVALQRRFTDDPAAYAAYQRGIAVRDELRRKLDLGNSESYARLARDMEVAVSLDSNFTLAWGQLARARIGEALAAPGDTSTRHHAMIVLKKALLRAPREPLVLLSDALATFNFEHDLRGALAKSAAALRLAPNDPEVLAWVSQWIWIDDLDSAAVLARRAAQIDPRSPWLLEKAGEIFFTRREPIVSRRYADAILALDSTDERGWATLYTAVLSQGDSSALQQLSVLMLRNVPHPGFYLAGYSIPANRLMSQWYLDLPAREQRLFNFSDSLIFLDNRIDAALVLEKAALVLRECHEIVDAFARPRKGFEATPDELAILAFALAAIGKQSEARVTLTRAIALARTTDPGTYPRSIYSDRVVIAYDRLGDVANTLAWLEQGLSKRGTGTVAWYAIHPRLAAFRRTQAWRDFVATHPDQAK